MDIIGNSFVTVDTRKIISNMNKVKQHVGEGIDIMAVLKANACGHGLVAMGKLLTEKCGIRYLAVAQVLEAKRLLEGGLSPEIPILVMGGIPDNSLPYAVEHDLLTPLYRTETAKKLSDLGSFYGIHPKVHIKIDTGLCRIGVRPGEELAQLLDCVRRLPNLIIDGIFTHFSDAEADDATTLQQLELFEQALAQVRAAGIDPPHVHAANSGATIRFPQAHYNMVRTQLTWLGYDATQDKHNRLGLETVLDWTAYLTNIRSVPAGTAVAYGRSVPWSRVNRDTRVAIGSFGYGDGYPASFKECGSYVLIRGKRAPIIQVCMDQTFLDVTDIPDAQVGDEVIMMGQSGTESIDGFTLYFNTGLSPLDILSGITDRSVRRYLE